MARARRGADRYLTTVLFTDIVDSTRRAGELGDRAWRDLVEQHHALIRLQLRRFGGREVDTAGDGFFAAFDAPARAVACALTIADLMPELGLQVRAGIHTGEVEESGGKLRGIAVHIGSRIGSVAGPGEVLTSATVRDLVAGSAIDFEDRGARELKGVTGEWYVFRAARGARFAEEFGAAGEAAGRDVAAVRRTVERRTRRRRLVIVTGVVVVVALAGAAAFVVTRPPPSIPVIDPNTAALVDPDSGRLVAEVPVGTRPEGIAFGEGSIWVANGTDGTVSRIDPSRRAVVQSIDVGAAPRGLAVGAGSVWVANSDERTVSRINAATNRVVQTITVGNGPSGVAFGAGSVWVTNMIDGSLTRIDPATGKPSGTFSVGRSPSAVAADDSAVWVADFDAGTVLKVDPRSGQTVASVAVGNGPRGIAIAAGAVWVANGVDGTVSRVDPVAARVSATVEVGQGAAGVAGSATVIWVASPLDGALYRIDPATNVATRIAIGAGPQDLAFAGDQLWFSASASAASHRGGRLAIVGQDPLDSIDPAVAFSPDSVSILSMTNDGLVGFQRTGGIAGATIVPDLATSLPRLADGGTSYTFVLRSGVTYSDGQPVGVEDFRHAIERVFEVPTTLDEATGAPFLDGIVGAPNCEKHIGTACDLSAGIVTDAAAGTVTFHLAAADPDFLDKLALPFAVATPASVGPKAVGDQPIPATGAYMVSTYSDKEIRIVRNPRFHEWSRLAKPDGYPDEMVWTIGPTVAEQVDMVLGGSADAMAGPPDRPDPARVDQLLAQYPAQVHSSVSGTLYVYMNAKTPPFDDVRVRRAVDFSLDRNRMVQLLGGPAEAEVTCQVLPPNTPGYQPYCPYTVNPNPGGTWTGPDLGAARDLITASGRAGAKVAVWTFGRFNSLGPYLSGLFGDLGFAADLRTFDGPDPFFHAIFDPANEAKVQANVVAWFPDFPSASDMFSPSFQCGVPPNFSHLCDDSMSAKIDGAQALQVSDPAAAGQAWAAADRAVVDLAPAAAFANQRAADIVAARVGNYQHHPQWGTLYDQLWVQ